MGRSGGSNNKLAAKLLAGADTRSREKFINPKKEKEKLVEEILNDLADIQKNSLTRGETPKEVKSIEVEEGDFSGKYLYGLNLSGSVLNKANFKDAELGYPSPNLGTILDNSNCQEANFKGANLEGVSFQQTDLSGASFEGADMASVDLAEANLIGANLTGAYLFQAGFSATEFGADTKLEYADIEDTNFVACNFMSGVSFQKSTLKQVSFKDVSLEWASFESTTIDDVFFGLSAENIFNCQEADFSGSLVSDFEFSCQTNFTQANFQNSSFKDGQFVQPNFKNAYLGQAGFKGVNFIDPNFDGAQLDGVVFEDCAFRGVERDKFINTLKERGAQFKNCVFSSSYTV